MNTTTRLLSFNAHEAYLYALSRIGFQWDVIDPLPGRYTKGWDTRIRPVPDNFRLITMEQALSAANRYHCIIAHSIDDLLSVKFLACPKILVIHVSLSGYITQENSPTRAEEMQQLLSTYLDKIGAISVAVSSMKQTTWGAIGPVIPFYIDSDFFNGYNGQIAAGLRVANQISQKSILLDWRNHQRIAEGFPVKLIGYNPDMPGVQRANDLYALRAYYRNHRFYLHTARYDFEDGFTTSSLEAMACGMPVVCNQHPSAPIINGINGFISDKAERLRESIRQLLADRALALRLGKAARDYVIENHSLQNFKQAWLKAIDLAVRFYR